MRRKKSAWAAWIACAATVLCNARSANAASYAPAVASLPKCNAAMGCPAGMPGDFVLTPAGWFHPSCIVPIHGDERWDTASGVITARSGSTRLAPPCGYLPRDRRGNAFVPGKAGVQPPFVNGWRATVWNAARIHAVGHLAATWTVPPNPAATNGGAVYLFPGLMTTGILQPVLAYNGADGTGGAALGWTITSWDCCDASGHNIMSDAPVAVNPGDTIVGTLTGSNCNASSGVCSTWQVTTADTTIQAQASATITGNVDAFGTAGAEVVGGALEIYLTACSQLPASTGTSFLDVVANDVNGASISPTNMDWTAVTWPPDCEPTSGFTHDNASSTVAIGWSTSVPTVPATPRAMAGLFGLLLAGAAGWRARSGHRRPRASAPRRGTRRTTWRGP